MKGPVAGSRAVDFEKLLAAAAPLIDLAIAEDIGPGDATSEATIPGDTMLTGRFVAKQRGVVAGLPVVGAVFARVDPRIRFEPLVEEGGPAEPGELIAIAEGPARALLRAERVALNFLQRLSGIATATKAYVDAVAVTDAVILDTRKTLPGFRALDKYAVQAGGGVNHRMGLYDMLLVKDNHADAVGGLARAGHAARAARPDLPLEVEVRDLEELDQALAIDPLPDRIMLDNMARPTLRAAVARVDGRVPLEASGGVKLDNIADIAATGVDAISVGALTHSVRALDISMKTAPPAVSVAGLLDEGRRLKRRLAGRVTVLGHHYQRDAVMELADFRGDSLGLARDAAATETEFIVFCGVHFMAETAAVLARPGQRVLIPDAGAGCFLADTASAPAVEAAWRKLGEALGGADDGILPVTYVNSSARLKAFCGRLGGAVCTSGNAEAVMRWALDRRRRVLFFPDQHLGRNIARRLGVEDRDMVLWRDEPSPDPDEIRSARVVLWPGACNVHRRFRLEHVRAARDRYPEVNVVVHPECGAEVVDAADDVGSTAHIIRRVEEAAPGTVWAIGTEARLVRRLQARHADRTVLPLSGVPAYCSTMSQITLDKLVRLLAALDQGRVLNEVSVDAETARWAREALQRMLALS